MDKEYQSENAPQPVQEASPGKPPAETKADLLSISLDSSGGLRFFLDGKRLETPETVTAEQRNLLIQLLLQLRPWVEGKTAAPASPPVAVRPIKTALGAASQPEKGAEKPAPGPKSIVAQIDELLQKRLDGTPLADREISLQESAMGGVDFKVGNQSYESMEAIPDPEIVKVIRAAITEWEKKI